MIDIKSNRVLRNALLDGPKQTGTYDAETNMPYIEEHLNHDEYIAAVRFLNWVYTNNRSYGHGNIDAVWTEAFRVK